MNYSDEQGTLMDIDGHWVTLMNYSDVSISGLQPRSYPSCKPKCTSPTRHDQAILSMISPVSSGRSKKEQRRSGNLR